MALELFANTPITSVTSGGATTPAPGTNENWTVSSPGNFPSASSSATPPTQFHISDPAAPSEVMAVINVSGSTWTVTRGAEGTTPVTHSSGFDVEQVVSAGALTQFISTATTMGDDLLGSYLPSAVVHSIQGVVISGTPVAGYALQATAPAAAAWSALPTATTSVPGMVQLDGTAGDIAALGSQAAGAVGKAADAGHVHPTTGVLLTGSAAGGDATGSLGSLVVTKTNGVSLGTAATKAVNTTTGTVAALGTQAAGSSGQVADAGHVHPTTGLITTAVAMAITGTPTSGQVFTASGANAAGWVTPSSPSGTLLASHSYGPGSEVTYNANTTTLTIMDGTNLTLSFTVPASGNVYIDVSADWALQTNALAGVATDMFLAIVKHATVGTIYGLKSWFGNDSTITAGANSSHRYNITGLTPGAIQIDLAMGCSGPLGSGGFADFYAVALGAAMSTDPGNPIWIQAFAA